MWISNPNEFQLCNFVHCAAYLQIPLSRYQMLLTISENKISSILDEGSENTANLQRKANNLEDTSSSGNKFIPGADLNPDLSVDCWVG